METNCVTINKRIGRNDKCLCKSGKKYKKCCELKNIETKINITKSSNNKYKLSESTLIENASSETIGELIKELKERYPKYIISDISNDINKDNYKNYQIANFNDKVIMLAEKNDLNQSVFNGRVNDLDSDIIVMYHGSYRTFTSYNYDIYIDSIFMMIDN